MDDNGDAGLSFIGLGASSDGGLGHDARDGRAVITSHYHSARCRHRDLALVIGTNLSGEGLRDALDPRFRG